MSKLWLCEGLCKPGCTRLFLSACEITSYLIQGSPSLLHLLSHVGLQLSFGFVFNKEFHFLTTEFHWNIYNCSIIYPWFIWWRNNLLIKKNKISIFIYYEDNGKGVFSLWKPLCYNIFQTQSLLLEPGKSDTQQYCFLPTHRLEIQLVSI